MDFYMMLVPDEIEKLFKAPPAANRIAVLWASDLDVELKMFYIQLELLAEEELYSNLIAREDYDEEEFYQRKLAKQLCVLDGIYAQFTQELLESCQATLYSNMQNLYAELCTLERSNNLVKADRLISRFGSASFVSERQIKRFKHAHKKTRKLEDSKTRRLEN